MEEMTFKNIVRGTQDLSFASELYKTFAKTVACFAVGADVKSARLSPARFRLGLLPPAGDDADDRSSKDVSVWIGSVEWELAPEQVIAGSELTLPALDNFGDFPLESVMEIELAWKKMMIGSSRNAVFEQPHIRFSDYVISFDSAPDDLNLLSDQAAKARSLDRYGGGSLEVTYSAQHWARCIVMYFDPLIRELCGTVYHRTHHETFELDLDAVRNGMDQYYDEVEIPWETWYVHKGRVRTIPPAYREAIKMAHVETWRQRTEQS